MRRVDGATVTSLTLGDLRPGPRSTRVHGGGTDIALGRNCDVTRDGRFLINTALDQAAAPITLIQHWQPAAKP